jgi:hypothetical protein
VFASVVVVTIAEYLVPAFRVPEGALYRPFGGVRVAAAAVQGAVVGATAGFLVTAWFYRESDPDTLALDTAVDVAVATALGFAIAEALVQWVARRQKATDA